MDDPYQDLISLAEASQRYGLNADYLRQLAIRGRLRARKIGRNWVTTPADVEAYIASRQRVGVFREDLGSEESSGGSVRRTDE